MFQSCGVKKRKSSGPGVVRIRGSLLGAAGFTLVEALDLRICQFTVFGILYGDGLKATATKLFLL